MCTDLKNKTLVKYVAKGFVCNNEMILKHVIFLNSVRMYICRDDSTSVKTILINVQVTNVTISKIHVKMFINDTFIFFSN